MFIIMGLEQKVKPVKPKRRYGLYAMVFFGMMGSCFESCKVEKIIDFIMETRQSDKSQKTSFYSKNATNDLYSYNNCSDYKLSSKQYF